MALGSYPTTRGTRIAMSESLEREVASLIVEILNLRADPADIDPEGPLFSSGLGLDSIDALELAMAISQKYGVQLRSDDSDNTRIFASLRALAAHIESNRRV
jgi:acyl carrier protein